VHIFIVEMGSYKKKEEIKKKKVEIVIIYVRKDLGVGKFFGTKNKILTVIGWIFKRTTG